MRDAGRGALPPFSLTLGIVGHRSAAIGERDPAVRARIGAAIADIARAAEVVLDRDARWFAPVPMRLSIVSPLADGADQIAADAALAHGYVLQAILPFERDHYRGTLPPESRAHFDELLGAAGCTLELPGNPRQAPLAYAMAGRATVAHCDLLIALWDGEVSRGRGGTAEVVELALAKGAPILHLPLDPDLPPSLLWSAYDPAVITHIGGDIDRRPYDAEHLAELLQTLLSPPPDPRERRYLDMFASEPTPRYRMRIEYPLMLAAARVAPFRKSHYHERSADAAREEYWNGECEGCTGRHGVEVPLDLVARSHHMSDRLAGYFSQTYRSGHVLNFVLAASSVLIGLAGFLFSQKLLLALIEFSLALGLIVNTRVGVKREWHRRWLDYRQLAERLRPLRSLKLTGIAAPDPPGSAANPIARRWIEWYATAVWRAMGCASGRIARDEVGPIAASIATHELDPQIHYHHKNSTQIMKLDRRLESLSSGIFYVTLLASIATIVALAIVPRLVDYYSDWLTLVSAGLPAVGAAVFGIRFQGDFGGSALRSDATAAGLADLAAELRGPDIGLSRVADVTEQAARSMFGDLSEWRLVNQQHDLSISS